MIEVNFDALPGPTHTNAGLSPDNRASQRNATRASNPKAAALEVLAKMKLVRDLGVTQAVLPPQERPDIATLRTLGYSGRDEDVLRHAAAEAPFILAQCSSSSSVWAANAAFVSPSCDAADGRVHFTPANLTTAFHRSLEAQTTQAILRRIFPAPRFVVHPPLPAHPQFADEGAANHVRLAPGAGEPGLNLLVYGASPLGGGAPAPSRIPPRQSLEASRAIARLHRLPPGRTVFAQQSPAVIDEGVFHNDVIATGHEQLFLFHERAYLDTAGTVAALQRIAADRLALAPVSEAELTVAEAVDSYLFNSQILSCPDGSMALVAPQECEAHPRARRVLDRLSASGCPLRAVHFVALRESMTNGGGPACLRLRVPLTAEEIGLGRARTLLDDALHGALVSWVQRHYRDRLTPADLGDPALLRESRTALDELTRILELGSIYPFQTSSREPAITHTAADDWISGAHDRVSIEG